METGWKAVVGTGNGGGRGQNSNWTTTSSTLAWDIWQLGTSSHYDWINTTLPSPTTVAGAMQHQVQYPSISTGDYAGAGSNFYPPDPQLMCLKLGKRHYFEDTLPLLGDRNEAVCKRRRVHSYGSFECGQSTAMVAPVQSPVVVVPRCQVQGCQARLLNGKDYHKRHKVCEMHSKAPKVIVNGIEQRFCQQCSRFHEVSEFDESKRSCRRRLAGHNERRRKSSYQLHSLISPPPPPPPPPSQGRPSSIMSMMPIGKHALSLLSSKNAVNNENWKVFSSSSSDLSSRCSAALRELIAENRAASNYTYLGKHHLLLDDKDNNTSNYNHTLIDQQRAFRNENQNNTSHDHEFRSWGHMNESDCTKVTLNLAPGPSFELQCMKGKADNKDAPHDVFGAL